MSYYGEWKPYVPVAARRRQAKNAMSKLRSKGADIRPVEIEGRKITKTFWGKAWCDHMEALGDFENRLPRGRTYVRNGSVCHLAIEKGCVTAMVSGSSLYHVKVEIGTLPKIKWRKVKSRCAGQIGSLLALLQGQLAESVMKVVTDSGNGLFPLSKEIRLSCSCPDWATMCKHVAAVLYGVGARLDEQPDLLFLLRGVNHHELISTSAADAVHRATRRGGKRPTLGRGDLGDVFGIEIEPATSRRKKAKPSKKTVPQATPKKPAAKSAKKKPVKKKTTKKKTTKKKPAKKNNNKKPAAKPNKKKAPKQRTTKKKTVTRTIKKSAAKKRAVKKRS